MENENAMAKGQIDEGWINALSKIFKEEINTLMLAIFENIRDMLYNGVAYNVLGVIAIYWLINRLKNGYPTREDLFKASIWIIHICIIYAIFYSVSTYKEFLSYLLIPASWVKSAVVSILGDNNDNIGMVATNAVNEINALKDKIFNAGFEKNADNTSNLTPDIFISMQTFFGMAFFWIYYASFMILIFGVVCIIMVSTFISMIILSIAPIVLPFFVIKFLKPYLFSWGKLFIAWSLYAPASFIILALCMKPISYLKGANYERIEDMYNNSFSNFLIPTLICLIGLFILTKIPNWISQIMGVQGMESGGAGAGLDTAKALALGGAKFAGGAGAAKMAGANAGQALTQGLINATPGAKSMQNQINNLRDKFISNDGITAKA